MTLDLILRTSAILLCGAGIAATLRRAAPATRHLVWNIALVAVVLAPYLVAIAPRVPIVPVVPRVPEVSFSTAAPVPVGISVEPVTQQNLTFGTLGTIGTLGTVVVGSWFVLCWLLSGLSVVRGSRPAPESWVSEARVIARRLGLRSDVPVRRLNRDASPHVAGLFRSVVMMPPSAETWTAEARHAAFVHQMSEAMGQHASLAGARARDHGQRPVHGRRRACLIHIERGQHAAHIAVGCGRRRRVGNRRGWLAVCP